MLGGGAHQGAGASDPSRAGNAAQALCVPGEKQLCRSSKAVKRVVNSVVNSVVLLL